MNVTANIVCYKSKTLANGEHPLMVRICKDGKKKYKSLGVSVNPKHWNLERNTLKPNCPNYLTPCVYRNGSGSSQHVLQRRENRNARNPSIAHH